MRAQSGFAPKRGGGCVDEYRGFSSGSASPKGAMFIFAASRSKRNLVHAENALELNTAAGNVRFKHYALAGHCALSQKIDRSFTEPRNRTRS
jgi:hypothetical protein